MNISKPIEINFDIEPNNKQEILIVEKSITDYIKYLSNITEKIQIEVLNYQLINTEEHLDFDDNRLIDRQLPTYCIQVLDDNEILGEFIYSYCSSKLYKQFQQWINNDIIYYVKSKAHYYDYDYQLRKNYQLNKYYKLKEHYRLKKYHKNKKAPF